MALSPLKELRQPSTATMLYDRPEAAKLDFPACIKQAEGEVSIATERMRSTKPPARSNAARRTAQLAVFA